MDNNDFRAKLTTKVSTLNKVASSNDEKSKALANGAPLKGISSVLGSSSKDTNNILAPLYPASGVIFPYTPIVQTGNTANYDKFNATHTNYAQNVYKNSETADIVLDDAVFTAQTEDEARYMLAVIHFFRTVTKMYFAAPIEKAGNPPPVLLFNYLGDRMFKDVPVVVTSANYALPNDVDYVRVPSLNDKAETGKYTMVPTYMKFTITLKPHYNPYKVTSEFNLDLFRTGKLLDRGYL